MREELINLFSCKLGDLLNGLKGNQYSDHRLNKYQDNLFQLFNTIEKGINSGRFDLKDKSHVNLINKSFNFLLTNIIYLEDSTLNQIPFETVYCIDKALKEWSKEDTVEYIIVTTLRHNTYFFHGYLSFDDTLYQYFSVIYGIDFKYRLIQISIPNRDVNDYLMNSVLYHELGHFVDSKYQIVQRIIDAEYATTPIEDKKKIANHLREHFADLFATQYSPSSIKYTLEYLASGNPESFTHPSTSDRLLLIERFLTGKEDEIIEKLMQSTEGIKKMHLEKRFTDIDFSDFYNLIPTVINSDQELHALFHSIWDIWLNHQDKFIDMDKKTIYKLLNNLAEKSISNYIIQKEWTKHASA